jgi:hypothetical protein
MADKVGVKHLEDDILDVLEYRVAEFSDNKKLFHSASDIFDTFSLLYKHSIPAANEFLKKYYPSPYREIDDALHMAMAGIITIPKRFKYTSSKDVNF